MKAATAQYDDGKTAICFMGHGTEAESNAIYAKMQTVMSDVAGAEADHQQFGFSDVVLVAGVVQVR